MKILLVDDARSVVLVLSQRLHSYGYEVVHAANGQEAVALFASAAPDLVLMDIEMPLMNGFEATNRIRAIEATRQWAWTPIIFLTSSDTVENLVTAIEAGGDDFMSKMVPEPVLHAKMKAMSRIATLRRSLSLANQRLQDMANLDGLTGLCNRRSLDARADVLWARARESGRSFGLLMLDIDNFKKFNDHYGHQRGDDCLRAVARTIAATVQHLGRHAAAATEQAVAAIAAEPEEVFAARYGGEEFAVIAPYIEQADLDDLAQAIVLSVASLGLVHEPNQPWGTVTLSVGQGWCARAQGELADLFRSADAALYQAKQNGRNRVAGP